MNMGQDRQMQMIGGNGGNQFRQYAGQNAGNLNGYNEVQNVGNQVAQNPRIQNIGNQNGLVGVQGNGIQNQIGNGNLVAAHAEGNAAGQNGNQIRCYNCRGIANLDKIEEVNANCILMANLQQASSSGTQTDSAPVYDSDGSAEVHENYDNNEIFNMFTQEEQYTELLEPIPEPQQVPQNDNNVISEATNVEQDGEIVEQHSANFEETHALYESLYQNLAVEVEKVNSVNRKLKETNADLTTELASTPMLYSAAMYKFGGVTIQLGIKILLGIRIRLGMAKEKDAAYLQTQLLIAQKEEAGIQLQAEEYDLMAAAADLDEIEEINANCILMANLQQASTSGTQTDSAPVYDTDGSAKNDNDVISKDTSVKQGGETIEQHPANLEETCALYESLYQNLAIEVEKVNSVNRKLKETNADMTTELARYKN
nr:hypothetical protein [Tanacetum cinerariifolium]